MADLSRKVIALFALGAGLVGGLVLSAAEAPVAVSDRGGAVGDPELPDPVRVIVRFRPGADAGDRAGARRAASAELEDVLPVSRMQLVDPTPGTSVRSAVERLERSPAVAYAEPDLPRAALARPNDTYFDLLWGLHNTGQTVAGRAGTVDADVDGEEAWDVTTGAAGVTVAVVDSGVDAGHPDLAPNMAEGHDWVDGDADPADLNGHGTHVAGTIAARGNDGTGVAGVAWRASLVPLRVLDAEGSGYVSDVIQAYAHARDRKLRVVNASLGGDSYSQAERDTIASAPETLFVVAAGNDGADNDATGSFPCNYDLVNVVCVAATDQDDQLAGFSNRGAVTVDLAAPGVNVASTWPGADWAFLDGTSMATPHVAGAAALLWSALPSATVADVRNILLDTVEPERSLLDVTATGGRLNTAGAVRHAAAVARGEAEVPPPPVGA
ncbi:MAG TPA: S8 family peptidase, partial [Thermoleophilaceae bacterium]|nr:S8 family peptidase [Thermoleophilaceae bacterium]